MNKLLIISTLFLLGGCVNINKEDTYSIKKEALLEIDDFVNSIKPLLIASLKQDHTGASGIDMCSASAQQLTKNYNKTLSSNMKIRRTALGYRNPLNKPDDIDKEVMNKMMGSKTMTPVIIKTTDGYRVYKPLVTLQMCLACHGDINAMNPKTVAKIKKYYPNDKAVGFKLGDLRGVVVAEIKK
ncbi:MAG: DUF3365 domain-containing protein [Sulfurovaceae bacterium]|nr:DUF3365 domain-containing protein [Sulfurovaceae bacterium]MDD5548127.1 DUF3365 domain-containing protein [Sulfurovaceae bacterium]